MSGWMATMKSALHWGEGEPEAGPLGDAGTTRIPEILGRWYEASSEALGWGFDAWYDAAVSPAVASLAAGRLDPAPLAALGAARAARGRSEQEALADLSHLLDAVAERPVDAGPAEEALLRGFREGAPVPGWFGDARTLSRRLRRLYDGGEPTAAGYALLLVDVDLTWLAGAERAMALVTAAERLHRQFPFADPIAGLGEPRLGVVVHRHPGLAVGSEALQMWLESDPLLAGATTLWLMPLPAAAAGVGPFVRELAGAQRPLRVRGYEPRAAASGGPGAELLKAVMPIAPRNEERRRSRLPVLLTDGSGMLAAAALAIFLAVGVARVVGPAGIPSTTPSSQPLQLALEPRLAEQPPRPAREALVATPPEPVPTPVEPVAAVRGHTVHRPVAPSPPPPPARAEPVVELPPPPVVTVVEEPTGPPRPPGTPGKGPKHDRTGDDSDDERGWQVAGDDSDDDRRGRRGRD